MRLSKCLVQHWLVAVDSRGLEMEGSSCVLVCPSLATHWTTGMAAYFLPGQTVPPTAAGLLRKAQCRLWWCPGVLHHLPEAWLLSDMTPRDVESEWQSQDLNSERSTPDTSVEPQDLPPLPLCGSS